MTQEISQVHTSCHDCCWAEWTEKHYGDNMEGTQIGCKLGRIAKYGDNVQGVYNGNSEFYVINDRVCQAKRDSKWFENAVAKFDISCDPNNSGSEIEHIKSQLYKELSLKFQLFILIEPRGHIQDDEVFEYVQETVQEVLEEWVAKLDTTPNIVLVNLSEVPSARFVDYLRNLEGHVFDWRVDNPYEWHGIDHYWHNAQNQSHQNPLYLSVWSTAFGEPECKAISLFVEINRLMNVELKQVGVVLPYDDTSGYTILNKLTPLCYYQMNKETGKYELWSSELELKEKLVYKAVEICPLEAPILD